MDEGYFPCDACGKPLTSGDLEVDENGQSVCPECGQNPEPDLGDDQCSS